METTYREENYKEVREDIEAMKDQHTEDMGTLRAMQNPYV
jgi:hypothetical protein